MNGKRPYKGNSILADIDDYTVIDLETTGRYVNSCEIIELSAVKVRNGVITETFSSLVQPSDLVPAEITAITGITNEMLVNAPRIDEIIEEYIEFIGEDIILGHNIASFDSTILYDICEGFNLSYFSNDMLDTLMYARHCDIDVPNFKLTTLTKYFGIEHQNAHRALADCIANHECYQILKSHFNRKFHAVSRERKQVSKKYSDDTKQLHELTGIIKDVMCDNVLTDDEIYYLKDWIDQNESLAGNYPFDVVSDAIKSVLEDGIITDEEKAFLVNVLSDFDDPVEKQAEKADNVCISGSQIVLTGEFFSGSREEITRRLEGMGATVKAAVSGKTDYVIVGGYGSSDWAHGNYGTKVKKALELQQKGNDIKIVKEEDFLKCLETV